jgi:uncharacterized protein (TIGR02266 family)
VREGPEAALKELDSAAVSGRFPPRIFRRVPFEAELRLRYEPGDAETIARTANISLGGTFVVSAEPRPPRTTLELSFKLPEQPAPVRGRGRVVWARERDEGPGRPAGMGVRFLELTPGSREQIFEVVERRVRDGGSPYDTGNEESGSIADRRDDTGPLPAVADAAAAGVEATPAAGEETAAGAGLPLSEPIAEAERERPTWERGTAMAEPVAPAPLPWEPAAVTDEPVARTEPEPPAWEPAAAAPEPPAPPPPLPVEMPEPEGRFHYPVGSAYAGRARGGARGWLIAAGAMLVVAAVAMAGYLLLAGGGTAEIAEAVRPPAPTWPSTAGDAAGGAAGAGARPPGAERRAVAGPDAGAADMERGDGPGAVWPGGGEPGAETAPEAGTGDREPGTGAASAETPGSAGAGRAARAEGGAGSEPGSRATRPTGAGAASAAGAASEGPPSPAELAAAAAAAEPAGAVAAPARRITRITWQQRDGATELVIWGDGRFVPGSYRSSSLGGERPRELIRLAGIIEPYAAGSVEVGTPQVSRVRTGHHVETEPDELHVVVDLAGPGVAASELRADGERLWLRLEGR